MRVALAFVAVLASFTMVACGPSAGSGSGCKDQIIAGDLVITEVFADFAPPAGGAGTDEGKEWFEVYNASDRPIELEGLTLVHSRPDGMKPDSHEMVKVTIAPGQFLTLGNSADDLLPAYVEYGYGADLGSMFNTDGGKLALTCGDTEIDSAIYDAVRSGHSRQLTAGQPPDYTVNDDQANWCEGTETEFESSNFGTPGQDNDCSPVVIGQCNDGGTLRATVPPAAGDLVLTEVMPQPAGDDALQEWIELKALADVDLNGIGVDRAGDTATPSLVESPDCIHVAAGSYVVLAKSTDVGMNGGLPAGAIVGTFKSTLSLINGSTTTPGDIQLVLGATVIDAISWTKSTASASVSLDPDLANSIANDDPSNFCAATATYDATSGNKGTPGAENGQCTLLPPAGQCSDGGTNRAIVKPAADQLVITEFLANAAGTGTDGAQEWFEITNTGVAAFDLNELKLQGNSTTINTILSSDCKSVPVGGFALFAHGTDPTANGMLPAVDATFTFPLSSKIQVLDGTTVLDVITFGTTPDGISKMLKLANTNVLDNDTPANFCDASATAVPTQQYGPAANFGTPKALNVCP